MTSRVISLYRILTRGGQIRPAGENSWAYVATWRRFFEMKDEEIASTEHTSDGSNDEFYVNGHDEVSVPKPAPVQSETAKRAREEFLMDGRRRQASPDNSNSTFGASDARERRGTARNESDIVSRPNIEIPIGGFQCNIAQ